MVSAEPNSSRLQHMLQSAVQAVQWTYSLFWQFCPRQGMLIWGEGYYNGAIKTRKTVQPMEAGTEEASLQRSQQLRELYDSLSAGESNQQLPARRPSAALSPEDLTESEWFYLMCVSFSFPPGVGLPGKAYAKGQHVWLTGANEVDSRVFSRAILAKSAHIQTVMCIPLMDGVVELGFTERIEENPSLIQQVKSFFIDHHEPPPPKPALSEHSTSNPAASSSDQSHCRPPQVFAMHGAIDPPPYANDKTANNEEEDGDDNDDEDSESPMDLSMSGQVGRNRDSVRHVQAEPSELMQLEMSEDIRLGSPEDASNNLDSDLHMAATDPMAQSDHHEIHGADSCKAAESSTRRWPVMMQQQQKQEKEQNDTHLVSNSLQLPPSGAHPLDELSQEDTHYSQTVSIILQFQSTASPASLSYFSCSPNSVFSRWSGLRSDVHHPSQEGTSQWLLKYILFTVPFLHAKCRALGESSRMLGQDPMTLSGLRPGKGGGTTPQDELSANHVLAERRRREKLNERFIILRSLVPFVTKMDKASILGDTIEYVKQLRKKIQDLEARARQIEGEHLRLVDANKAEVDKRKVRVVEDGGEGSAKAKAVEPSPPEVVQVSIIESDALVELQCPYKEGLLLDVMLTLREMRVEVTSVQSCLINGFFKAEIRAKVKENASGKKASIVEVKRAINQMVPHADSYS